MHYLHFNKGSNGQTIITMQFLGRNYPKVIYGMGIFEFGKHLTKTKKKEGLNCIFATITKFEGAKCKITITMMISGSSYPKNIYGMPLDELEVQIKFEFEFKFKFELNKKEMQKKRKRKRAQTPHGLASGEKA